MVLYLPIIDSINAQDNKKLPKTWSTKLEEFMMGDLFKIQVRGFELFQWIVLWFWVCPCKKASRFCVIFFDWQDQAKLILRNGDQSDRAQQAFLSYRSWIKRFLTAEDGETQKYPFVNAFKAYVSKLSTEVLSCL